MSYDQPSVSSPYPMPVDPAYGSQYYPPPPRRLNGLAIGSMITSILSLTSCLVLFSPVGIVLGHVARKQVAKRNEQGAEMALAGIIVGWVGTALLLLGIAVFAFALLAGSKSN